ncbi:MAG: hypothetical protein KKG99_00040 [Bacteroidetes bacterium]|nr:hypothetical protein [Bacteroidota bacterium]
MKLFLTKTWAELKGKERRQFMAHVVSLMGKGGQRRAQKELGWDRGTIRKGLKELKTGIICVDNFSGRGRKPSESKFPSVLEDIKSIIEPICQTDPTFRSIQLYSPITAKEVHNRLVEFKGYSTDDIPSVITINRELCMIRIFSGFSILGKFFHTLGAIGGGRAIKFVASPMLASSISPPFEAVFPGFWDPGAPIHLNWSNI